MLEKLKQLVTEEEGQGMVEYGLILALVAIVVIAALTNIGDSINTTFEKIKAQLEAANQKGPT